MVNPNPDLPVAQCISREIRQHAPDAARIHSHGIDLGLHLAAQLHILLTRSLGKTFDRVGDEIADRVVSQIELQAARIQLRDFKQIVDQVRQRSNGAW
jgi:hypothetical protein